MMRRLRTLAAVVAAFAFGATVASATAAPSALFQIDNRGRVTREWTAIPGTDCYEASNGGVLSPTRSRADCTIAPTTTTTVAPTTTTTVAPTTTTTTTTTVAPTTTTTTAPPSGVQYVNTFDTAADLARLDPWVYHRNVDIHDFWGFSGGSWAGDHDTACNGADTQRTLTFTPGDTQAERVAESVYWCRQHFMTSMGDVDGYSIVSFSPDQVFASVSEVCVDVNLTDLGTRQWWKIGVVTDQLYRSTVNGVPGFLVSDISASDLPALVAANRQIASWSGVGAYPAKLRIGNTVGQIVNPTPDDKMTRHPVCFTDNGNGTLTFTVAGQSMTRSGSFPTGPLRVVIYDHNYTPTKSESGYPQGFTWHWDNLVVN